MMRFAYLIAFLTVAVSSAAALAWDACRGQPLGQNELYTCKAYDDDDGLIEKICADGEPCASGFDISCCEVLSPGGAFLSVRCICQAGEDDGGGGCPPDSLSCDPPPLG